MIVPIKDLYLRKGAAWVKTLILEAKRLVQRCLTVHYCTTAVVQFSTAIPKQLNSAVIVHRMMFENTFSKENGAFSGSNIFDKGLK